MHELPDDAARRCPDDGAFGDLLQPDEARPSRLLLVCPRCGAWIVLARVGGGWRELARHFGERAG